MSDPTKRPEPGSPFPSGPSPTGSPFPSGPPSPGPALPSVVPPNLYPPSPMPADLNVRKSQGWGWNPLIGITYNGFPVGIVVVVVIGLFVLAGR